jgi:pimeloyl-ACP methyl ester carboxylesterase
MLPKLILIHGLNNNLQAFSPLMDRFKSLGYECHLICLPGHGEIREEARELNNAFNCFDRNITPLTDRPYFIIAFSHGALYTQLWLEKRPDRRPLGQILLAPAFYIKRHSVTEFLMNKLPAFFLIKSIAPKALRKYSALRVWEYRILLRGMKSFQKLRSPFKIPTLILVDPLDELLDTKLLEEKVQSKTNFVLWPRKNLKKGMGCHHIIFHPDYFEKEDWDKFIKKICEFINAEV